MTKINFFRLIIWLVLGLGLILSLTNPNWALALDESNIDIEQRDRQLILTTNNVDSNDLSWQYATSSNSSCSDEDNHAFTELVINVFESQVAVDIDDSADKYYCFKIEDNLNQTVVFISYQVRRTTNPNSDIPKITIRRINQNILLFSTEDNQDLNHATWRYAMFDFNPNCLELSNELTNQLSSDLVINLLPQDVGKYLCVKVANIEGVYGYYEYVIPNIDNTPPVIKVTTNNRLLTISADEPIQAWSYINNQHDFQCNEASFRNNVSIVYNKTQILINDNQLNHYFCFRAIDTNGLRGFFKYQIRAENIGIPKIDLRQKDYVVQVQTEADNINNWRYIKFSQNSVCNQNANFKSAFQFSPDNGIRIAQADHNHYVCVRATNTANISGYAKIKLDTQGPPITLKLNKRTGIITASSTSKDVQFSYLKSRQEIKCNNHNQAEFEKANIELHLGNTSQLYQKDNGTWMCFRATDDLGNHAYEKWQAQGITTLTPGTTTSSSGGQQLIIVITILSGAMVLLLVSAWSKKRNQPQALAQPIPPNQATKSNQHTPLQQPQPQPQPQPQSQPVSSEDKIEALDYLDKRDDPPRN